MIKTYEIATIRQLPEFDVYIDVRSPSEFAEDHLPGAINCPVLSDDERAQIGTLYKQESPFAARRHGAVFIANNIARHLADRFWQQPPTWKPLIYCWRGGQRSASMTTIFRQIGWRAKQLEGGYKAWRRHVIGELATLPSTFSFRVLRGATGTGKSGILRALQQMGEQVLDLETLAAHKGSVFGLTPGPASQPTQKRFESLLYKALQAFDPQCPVYIEAESRKIGQIQLPTTLLQQMHQGQCIEISAPFEQRIAFLIKDYHYFLAERAQLHACIQALAHLQGHQQIRRWQELIDRGDWPSLIGGLLKQHYDPLYYRSLNNHYSDVPQNRQFCLDSIDENNFVRIATLIKHQSY